MIPSDPPSFEWAMEHHSQDFELQRRIQRWHENETRRLQLELTQAKKDAEHQANLAALYRATDDDLRGQLTNMRRAYEALLRKD